MSWRARCGRTMPTASVPATTTVCWFGAEMIWLAQVACRLYPWALSLVSMRALPALRSAAGAGQAAPPGRRRAPARGPGRPRGRGGAWGVQASDPVGGLVNLAGQVQVNAGEHAQRCCIPVTGIDGSQGVGHGPRGLGNHLSITGVGLGLSWGQVGDAPHGQSREVALSDSHVLGHCHGQSPDGDGLVDHRKEASVVLQLLVEGS